MCEMQHDDFDTSIQCEEFYGEEPPLIDDEDDILPDDPPVVDNEEGDDVEGDTDDSYWFTEDGGLTAEAYDWLAERDSENGFC